MKLDSASDKPSLEVMPAPQGALRGPGGPFESCQERDWSSWSWQLRNRFKDPGQLREALGLSPQDSAQTVADEFPFSVTPYYANLVDSSDPNDPILRQILPDPRELDLGGASLDPFEEKSLEVAPGLVHRYPDRALFVLTNFCSTLCRHCMRKREWREGFRRLSDEEIEQSLNYLEQHPEIRDVLISGGDPLELSTRILTRVLGRLRSFEWLDVVRIGSRTLVTAPQRFDDSFVDELAKYSPLYINTHFNHPRELSPDAVAACLRLVRAGVILGNQSVLLAGVNDDSEVLLSLSRALLKAGVRPYYLHHCDPIAGLDHLRVPLEKGRRLIKSLYGRVTGLGIPRLTIDLPGAGGKVPVDPGFQKAQLPGAEVYESPLSGDWISVEEEAPTEKNE